jgi:two-component system phosphate regulon sensor histidine kinase PhoR
VKPGIRLKLFLFSLTLIGIAIVAAEVYLSRALESQLTQHIQNDLIVRARLVAQRVAARMAALDDPRTADALADEIAGVAAVRVTIVNSDGTVAGDSAVDVSELERSENQGGRTEIAAALAAGHGTSVRYDEVTGRTTMYAAAAITRRSIPLGAARVSVPLTELENAIGQMHRSLWTGALVAFAVAGVISFYAAQLTSRKLRELTEAAREMSAGNLATRTRASGHDEIVALGKALDQLADNLSRSLNELRSERDLLTGILSSMNEGVLVVGADGRIVLTNPALRAMLLIGPDALGRSVLQVVRNADLNQVLERAARGVESEVELDLAGLMPRRALVRAVALKDAPGGVLAVFVDVTELRRLEAVRRDFVANASHELRSPLTTVRAAAETLGTVENDAKASARFVELIQRNAERLANLIDDLLELSRIESRELKLEVERIDLSTVVDRTFSQHAHRAQMKHITLAHDVLRTADVRADRRALEHVLGNLVDNALKYCPEGAAVRVSAAPTANGTVRVTVADTGPGIAPEHLPRVFERFYRVDAGRSRELGGTGLGLSIVKHLVEAMGGAVSVDSKVGAGSAFSFTLHRA